MPGHVQDVARDAIRVRGPRRDGFERLRGGAKEREDDHDIHRLMATAAGDTRWRADPVVAATFHGCARLRHDQRAKTGHAKDEEKQDCDLREATHQRSLPRGFVTHARCPDSTCVAGAQGVRHRPLRVPGL